MRVELTGSAVGAVTFGVALVSGLDVEIASSSAFVAVALLVYLRGRITT